MHPVGQILSRSLQRRSEELDMFVYPLWEFWLKISDFISNGSRSSNNWSWPIWKRRWPCASGFRKRSTMTMNSGLMSGFQMKHTSSWMVQNWMLWEIENPYRIIRSLLQKQKPKKSNKQTNKNKKQKKKKRTALVTISKHVTVGLFFFEDVHGNAVTVTKKCYILVLEQF